MAAGGLKAVDQNTRFQNINSVKRVNILNILNILGYKFVSRDDGLCKE